MSGADRRKTGQQNPFLGGRTRNKVASSQSVARKIHLARKNPAISFSQAGSAALMPVRHFFCGIPVAYGRSGHLYSAAAIDRCRLETAIEGEADRASY